MYYPDSIDHPFIDQITGTPYPKLYYLPISYLLGDSNDMVWMQFTGLKDKNGNDVWGGDVVRGKNCCGESITEEVVYDDACFYPFTSCGTCGDSNISDYYVLGNKYEHPELLTNN